MSEKQEKRRLRVAREWYWRKYAKWCLWRPPRVFFWRYKKWKNAEPKWPG